MAHHPSGPRPGDRSTAARASARRGWYLLLVVPLVGTLIPAIYNTRDPEFIGIPFFYWYQMVWVPLSVICTIIVYRVSRGRR